MAILSLAACATPSRMAPSLEVTTGRAAIAAQLNDCIDRYFASHADIIAPGAGSVVIARNGEVLLSRAYGLANIEWHVPATPQTRFRIWSLTKMFTATAAMILEQEGRLRLDDPVCSYMDSCPSSWRPITIRQVLSNTSGIPDFTGAPVPNIPWHVPEQFGGRFSRPFQEDPLFKARATSMEVLNLLQSAPLVFAPGTRYDYSNGGFYVAGLVIERAAGQPFKDILQTRIFDPLGMQDSGLFENDQVLPRMAFAYEAQFVDDQFVGVTPAPYVDYSWMFSAAALYSTTEDLAKFDRAIEQHQLLPAQTWHMMMAPSGVPTHHANRLSTYGLGFETWQDPDGLRLGHIGAGAGFGNTFYRYERDGVTLINLTTASIGLHLVAPTLRAIIAADGRASEEVLNQCAG